MTVEYRTRLIGLLTILNIKNVEITAFFVDEILIFLNTAFCKRLQRLVHRNGGFFMGRKDYTTDLGEDN